jgi:hypothetical protein
MSTAGLIVPNLTPGQLLRQVPLAAVRGWAERSAEPSQAVVLPYQFHTRRLVATT